MTDFAVGLITPCFIYKFLTTVHSGETAYVYVLLLGVSSIHLRQAQED